RNGRLPLLRRARSPGRRPRLAGPLAALPLRGPPGAGPGAPLAGQPAAADTGRGPRRPALLTAVADEVDERPSRGRLVAAPPPNEPHGEPNGWAQLPHLDRRALAADQRKGQRRGAESGRHQAAQEEGIAALERDPQRL